MLRMILMLIGLGDHDAHDGHFDHVDAHGEHMDGHDADTSFTLFSLHGMTSFFMMFGIVGLALSKMWVPNILSAAGGVGAGLFTVWVLGKVLVGMTKLQADGTLRMQNAIGKEGKVYLTIPAEQTGQVEIAIQNHLKIFDAVSSTKEEIKTGEHVMVIDVIRGNVLVVEKN